MAMKMASLENRRQHEAHQPRQGHLQVVIPGRHRPEPLDLQGTSRGVDHAPQLALRIVVLDTLIVVLMNICY